MRPQTYIILLIGLILASCQSEKPANSYRIIPEPQEMVMTKGKISMSDTTGWIHTQISSDFMAGGEEAYELRVEPNGIWITANTATGIFYGKQTLDQILPPGGLKGEIEIPCITIRDWPAFWYRGGMLDVSRHFFPKDFILKYIDILAFHKLNTFHWHLTDGTAWRLDLDAFPELTAEVDSYSQADVREIVAYAKKNHITIVPEIEMPGHSDAALNIYPSLSCNQDHPVGIYCAGKEETFDFLEQVLTEVIDLFPSKLIHIGGDEVGKGTWAGCSHCQERIKQQGLADENELQSYFVKRIAAFLESRGKEMIGWDEIMEGGLAANAKVMSWRGMAGGIEASQMGHDVVMSPGYPCYFDHYQSSHSDEPQAWGGLNGIKDVYGFDPVPEDIPEEKKHHILGGQANLWTEQIANPEHAEYMMMPRYSALSEALWSGREKRNWGKFERKLIIQLLRYEALGYNFAGSAFTPVIGTKFNANDGGLRVEISRELNLYPLHYTLDGSIPKSSSPVYKGELVVRQGQSVNALTFREGKPIGFMTVLKDIPNKATGKKVTYNTRWEDAYSANLEEAFTDAQLASKRGDHPNWQGFKVNNLDVVVDFQEETEVSGVWLRFFQHAGMTRVMLPEMVSVFGSNDGNEFNLISEKKLEMDTSLQAMIKKIKLEFSPQKYQFIKIVATNPRELFPGHPREGMEAWIFCDELGIE